MLKTIWTKARPAIKWILGLAVFAECLYVSTATVTAFIAAPWLNTSLAGLASWAGFTLPAWVATAVSTSPWFVLVVTAIHGAFVIAPIAFSTVLATIAGVLAQTAAHELWQTWQTRKLENQRDGSEVEHE